MTFPEAPSRSVSKREAALRQIHAALRLLKEGQLEPAITLALAAEGSVPSTDSPHLFKAVTDKRPGVHGELNAVRDWLKHNKPNDRMVITETDAIIALIRATSRYCAVYPDASPEIASFEDWCRANKYVG